MAEPIAAVWRAFDRGRAVADNFFADDARRAHDPHLWAHLARYEAVLSLKDEPGRDNWGMRWPHHSGIEFEVAPFTVKVCKAMGDGPQSPGRNRVRRQFFQQFSLSLFGGEHSANLLLFWRVIGNDLQLGLCKPKGLWKFRGQPKLEWQCPITYDPLAGLTFQMGDEDIPIFMADTEADEAGQA